ncbi:helix-turn-helix domain-containing protein [Paenibacillus abyssi]|nr:helix-turn-helix domain-containing protein [Paenibacillus abyssi]
MNWYYRTMLSYAPIFFVVISSLIFVFFTTLNRSSEQKYIETNQAILQQTIRNMDANLQLTERNIVSEMFTDGILQSYFTGEPKSLYDYFIIQKQLADFSSTLPFENTIYLYNEHTGKVLSGSGMVELDTFNDKSFFSSVYEQGNSAGWTSTRDFNPSILDDTTQQVVSLVKVFPYGSNEQGAVVVNLYVKSLIEFLSRFNSGGNGAVQLLDADKQPFPGAAEPDMGEQIYAASGYTGWYFYSDSVHANEYSMLSLLSNLWFVAVLIIIVLALLWFTFITHVNYKPIQAILGKINGYTARKSEELGIKIPRNEFKFIETAIDHLLEKSVDYDALHKEEMLLRQRNLFHELLTGHQVLTDLEWERQMASFGLPHACQRLGVIALEIDHYTAFTEKYSPSDQYLLKFLIETAFRELAQQRELFVWHVWVQPHQLAAVLHLSGSDEPYQETLRRLGEEFRGWINAHLELTLSVGIGSETDTIRSISCSYRNANENAAYKAVFGTNTVIDNDKTNTRTNGETFACFQKVLEMTRFYRMDDEQWVDKLNQIFFKLKQMLISKNDIVTFMNNLIHQLQKDIKLLPPGVQALWKEDYQSRFERIASHTETIEELHERLLTMMTGLAAEIDQERNSRKHHAIALQMKEYIDRHYSDPGLSLVQVGDQYGLSARSASNLFKEELGEKFIDYLLKVRFAHAKNMLVETDEPIQTIAEKVGYSHVISFHRAFKKLFDLPPGEFRAMNRAHEE